MKRSVSFDAMDTECVNGADGNGTNSHLCRDDGGDNIAVETRDSPTINMESSQSLRRLRRLSASPPPRREPPPLHHPSRPSASFFETSSGSFATVEAQRDVTSHMWEQLPHGHQIVDLESELDSDRPGSDEFEYEVVIGNVGGQTSYHHGEASSFANMVGVGMIVPYEFETASRHGVPNHNTDHDGTEAVGSAYDTGGPPWLPIEGCESESESNSASTCPSSPYESYFDEDETLVFMRFGFHYCEQCVPVPDPPTALCSTCRAPLRERRLVRGPIEGFHRYDNYPGPRYFHYARHRCDTCWLTGVCDICGYFLRDFRPA